MKIAVVCYDLSSKAPSVRAKTIIESLANFANFEKLIVITSRNEKSYLNVSKRIPVEIHRIMDFKNPLQFVRMLIEMHRILNGVDLVHVPINFFQAFIVRMVYRGSITLDVGIQQPRFWRMLTKCIIKPKIVLKPNPRSSLAWRLDGVNSIPILPPRDSSKFRPYSGEEIHEIRQKEGIAKDAKVILYVGKLNEYKGAHIFYTLVKEISKKRGDVIFLVIGDGPLRSLFENENGVIYKGFIPNDELPKYYNMADLVVVPNKEAATYGGLVAVESALCGTPVINTTKISGYRIQELDKAYIWCERDAKAIAEKVELLLENRKLYRKISVKARKIVKAVFPDYKRFAERYMRFFIKVVREQLK